MHDKLDTVGFISITRYRNIDRGIGDLAIIAAPRDQTISPMKASLTHGCLYVVCDSMVDISMLCVSVVCAHKRHATAS